MVCLVIYIITPTPETERPLWKMRNRKLRVRGSTWLQGNPVLDSVDSLHMNSQQLIQHTQELTELKTDKILDWRGGAREILLLAEELLAIDSCWKRGSQFCLRVKSPGGLTMLQ